ncbi:MAG: aminopeptidase P family protein [Pirellulaceae bacterium]|nr:aminopeptidase P family protein [Pirellulaceae bacterium]
MQRYTFFSAVLFLSYATFLSGGTVLPAKGQERLADQTPKTDERLRKDLVERRERVFAQMEDDSILIVRGNHSKGHLRGIFRQFDNFYYLTGINDPGGVVLLKKAAGETSSRLYFPRQNKEKILWDAQTLGVDGARQVSAIDDTRDEVSFQREFEPLLENVKTVYYDSEENHDEFGERLEGLALSLKPASRIVHSLRRVKTAYEVDLIRRAAMISCEGHKELMRSAKPGLNEFELQAILEYVFRFNGAQDTGYSSIVGSGPNSCILHWSRNDRYTRNNEVVLVDAGAEYKNYTADVTRTFPVNGKFTERQREIYAIVLKANTEATKLVKPGVSTGEVFAKANDEIFKGLKELGMVETRREVRRFLMHGIGHSVGLNVHDVGGLGVLEEGMVITIEPGIYIANEAIGIRIEDNILVTKDGYENLSINLPRTADEVEDLMKEEGMRFSRYMINNVNK